MTLRFSSRELQDLAIAWIALGVAFAIFFAGGGSRALTMLLDEGIVRPFLVSLVTAGLGFLLHELAHKVVAVRFDQVAEFRADYGMLFLAVMSALVGFLFAAPGAVHHHGRLTQREHGLIALAGPATNAVLAFVFAPVYVVGLLAGSPLLSLVGGRGVAINLFLAAFNLVPFGGLDGRTVLDWSKPVFVAAFVPAAVVALFVVFVLGIGF
ncbi:MAG: metalloprotease [Haloplanus sp.]